MPELGLIEGRPAIEWDEEISHRDRIWRIERHCWIKDTGGKIRPLGRLKRGQERVLAVIEWLREKKLPIRVIVLKGRKVGISTLDQADLICEVMDRQIDAMVIAHDLPTTRLIHSMAKLMMQKYDLSKPELHKDNLRELTFLNHHGRIILDTANNKFAGTGATPQYLQASEVAKWEIGSQTAISLFQAVANRPGTAIIIESTANGYDALFHPMWKAASENCEIEFEQKVDASFKKRWRVKDVKIKDREAWNYYYPVFVGVLDDPECYVGFADDADREQFATSLTTEEKEILEQYKSGGCNLQYLNYRRYTLKNSCQNDIEIYHQEHPEHENHAFLASGRPRFNRERLSKMAVERGSVGWLETKQVAWRPQIIWLDDDGEFLRRFRAPVHGHHYAIGVDVAEGRIPEGAREADRSVAIVLDIDDGCRQVATLTHAALGPEGMGQRLKVLGRWYNQAFIVCEKNNQGAATLMELKNGDDAYPPEKVYRMGQEQGRHQTDPGWVTSAQSRPRLLTKLAHAITEGTVALHDAKTIEECQNFVYGKTGTAAAQLGFHDDHVLALGMAVMGAEWYPWQVDDFRADTYRHLRARQQRYAAMSPITGYAVAGASFAALLMRMIP